MDLTLLLAGTGAIILAAFICLKLRQMMPTSVNCWFCNKNTKVDFALRNSWYCPHCEQYNGFAQDGGYNKVIEEQHSAALNTKVFNASKSFGSSVLNKSNGFCDMCTVNQQLKVQQLAHFVPICKDNYDEEIKEYRELLEKSYQLCSKCEKVLEKTLRKQCSELNLPFRHESETIDPVHVKRIYFKNSSKSKIQLISRIISTLIAIWFFVTSICLNNLISKYFSWHWSEVFIKEFLQETYLRELSGIGFLCHYITICGNHRIIINGINLILWILLHCFAWFDQSSLRSTLSTMLMISIVFGNFITERLDRFKVSKKNECVPWTKENGEVACDFFEFEKADIRGPEIKPLPKKRKKKEKQSDSFFVNRPSESINDDLGTGFGLGFFSQDYVSPVYCEKINSGMTNLNLGKANEKSRRSSNFLFQSRSFNDRKYSLLKPAKFFGHSPNTYCNPEYEESLSRSSTPSLFPGQRFDSYNFAERLPLKTSYPVNRCNEFDFDYRPSNFYPCSGPLYSCGLPADFSFPPRNYGYDTVCSSSFTDDRRPDEITSRDEKRFKSKSKSLFYLLSLFLNLITLFFFVCRLWPEFFLYNFKLPNFNFYL